MVELASRGQDITPMELAQATRNRGMPLEALRHDITPVGLHYLLIHFDIPALDPASWRLHVAGHVRRELELTLEQLRARPASTLPVTLECAGNGRARLDPRPMTQPWLNEAVSTASWTGAPLAGVLEEAGVKQGSVEVVLTGADHGIEGGEELDYARSLPLTEAMRPEVLLAYEMNGRPLEPQHGFPLRMVVPGWYGMTSVKWLSRILVVTEPFRGFHQAVAYRYQRSEEDRGEPVTRIRPRALMIPPASPTSRSATGTSSAAPSRSRAEPGAAPRRSCASNCGSTATGSTRISPRRPGSGRGAAGRTSGRRPPASTRCPAGRRTRREKPNPRNRVGTSRAWETTSSKTSTSPFADAKARTGGAWRRRRGAWRG